MPDPRLIPYVPFARATHAKFYPRGPFASIILAQGIIESAWFTRTSGRNNFFGIKANPEQISTGQFTTVWTHETLHGIYQKILQPFANYPDIQTCFDAHANLLTTPWYHLCIAATTPAAYAHALWLSHYATGIPGHPYDRVLIDLMTARDLYQFDLPMKD